MWDKLKLRWNFHINCSIWITLVNKLVATAGKNSIVKINGTLVLNSVEPQCWYFITLRLYSRQQYQWLYHKFSCLFQVIPPSESVFTRCHSNCILGKKSRMFIFFLLILLLHIKGKGIQCYVKIKLLLISIIIVSGVLY